MWPKREDITPDGYRDVYMTRWLLLSTKWFTIRLHLFRRSDNDVMHDHPWPFISILLWRGYFEETPKGKRWYIPGSILYRPAVWIHKVILKNNLPCLTLCVTGKKVREWGFHCPERWKHWKEFFTTNKCD